MSNAFRFIIQDRAIAFHTAFGRMMKGAAGGLWLTQMFYADARTAEKNAGGYDGWFGKRRSELMEEAALTRRECDQARDKAVELGILEIRSTGMPAHNEYRFAYDKVEQMIAALVGTPSYQQDGTPSYQHDGTESRSNRATDSLDIEKSTNRERDSESSRTVETIPARAADNFVWGTGPGKRFRCDCPERTRLEWNPRQDRTPCCKREIIWRHLKPKTPMAVLLFETHEYWNGFRDKNERRAWEDAENTYGDEAMQHTIDWAVNTARISANRVVASILTAAQNNASPTPKAIPSNGSIGPPAPRDVSKLRRE